MVTIEIGGRSFEVAPLKLGQLRRAAPFVDELNRLIGEQEERKKEAETAGLKAPDPSMSEMTALTRALCEIIAIGLSKADPSMTADAIEDEVDLSFLGSLQVAAFALLKSSGLSQKGEAEALSPPRAEGAED